MSESPQVKRYLLFNITNLVHELLKKLLNDSFTDGGYAHTRKKNLGKHAIRKYQKNVKYGCRRSLTPSLPSTNQKHAKLDILFLKPCPILLYLFTLRQIFCPELQNNSGITFSTFILQFIVTLNESRKYLPTMYMK